MKKFRHILCIAVTAGFALLGVFGFPHALSRLWEGARDLGTSASFYFCELFGIENNVTPTVTTLSKKIPAFTLFPGSWGEFTERVKTYLSKCISADNLKGYGLFLSDKLLKLSRFLVIILPFILAVVILFRSYINKENNDYDKDSKALSIYKRVISKTFSPAWKWVTDTYNFIREKKYYYIPWFVMWLLYFNIFTIVTEFVAYYLYFVAAFEVKTLFTQIYKLVTDLSVMFGFVPVWVWVIAGAFFLDKIRKNAGYRRLMHFENRNKGFISERPIVYMVCGTMGRKKTTAITDMALSQEAMFRDKAFEKILENDLKFPFFPWINLENSIKTAMKYHEVYNLATIKEYVRKKRERWSKNPCKEKIYNYDYERYGLTYDDKLKVVDVWEVIETYAQLYFIYVIESSLIISNYSIRTDGIMCDTGNFPLFSSEFFKRDSRLIEAYSRHSHILDFDSLRLGKKMVEDNVHADSFEFGVVVITEVGKERGNNLELTEKKKRDETANQKNDLFNAWLKMVRHSATVDNFPFVKVITDEQRPESWGADARDLCEIVHIAECGETYLTIKNIYSKSVKLWTDDHDLWIKSITYYYVSSDSDIVKVEAVAPTCTVDGNIEYWYDYYNDLAFSEEECENVIFKENLVVPATGHDFGEWEITTEPTCTEKGRQRRVCANCNKEEYLDVPALGHKMVYTQAREATCNELGLTTDGEICSRCGYTTIETIPFADHTWSRWIDSETEEGKEVHTCRICGTSERRDIVSGSDTIETNTSQNNYSGHYTDIYVPQAGDGDGARADRDDGGIYITAKDGRLIEKIVCSVGFGEDNSNGAYVNKGNVIVTDEGYTITVENIYSNYVAFRAQEYLQISTITVYFVQFGTLIKTDATDPTCTEEGNVEYWFDAYSNMYFLDESCQNQITDLSLTVLPALGHSAASEWVVTKESTCTEYGRYLLHFYCILLYIL